MDLDQTSKIQFQPKNWKYSKNRLSPLITQHTVIWRRHSKDINLSKQLSCELGSAEFFKVLNYRGCLYIVSQAELATLLGQNPESNKSSKPSYQEHQSNMVGEMVINGYNQSRKKCEDFRTTTSRVSLSWILKVLDLETQDEAWWYGNILQQQVSSMSHIFRDWTSFNNCNKKHLKALDVVNLASPKDE